VGFWLFVFSLTIVLGCAPAKKAEKLFTPSIAEEKEMGQEFAHKASKKLTLVENPEVLEYLYRIGAPIVQAAQPMTYRFRFHVVKNPTLNAFAVPGGHIYLYSGLLLKVRNVDEIAGVIAHELSHVKLRHSAQMIGKGTLVSLATLAAVIAARGQAPVAAGAVGAGQAIQLAFSRKFEQEADRSGLFYLHRAGYDPNGLTGFFNMMVREQKFSTSDIPPYLLTHPVTADRMEQIDNLIRHYRLEFDDPPEFPDFYRFLGILRAEVEDSTRVIPLLKQRVKDDPDDARRWHQLGLAYDRFGWVKEAIVALQKAVEIDSRLWPACVDFGILQARESPLTGLKPDLRPSAQGWNLEGDGGRGRVPRGDGTVLRETRSIQGGHQASDKSAQDLR
jgi:predicted Zn-dependent protease